MGISIELTSIRQYRSPLSNTQIDHLADTLQTLLRRHFVMNDIYQESPGDESYHPDVSRSHVYDGFILVIPYLPQNLERSIVGLVKSHLNDYAYNVYTERVKNLRTVFNVSSSSKSTYTVMKIANLRDAFEAEYGGLSEARKRFSMTIKSPTSFELTCTHPDEDLELVEAVLRAKAGPINIPGFKIAGPLEVL